MTIDLYYTKTSTQATAIRMIAAALGVELNLILVDIRAGEHLKPEFLKINPQHTIPTLDDNGFGIWESRAILTYLIDKYGKPNDSLLPSDPQTRAIINQRLYFDIDVLYRGYITAVMGLALAKQPPSEELLNKLQNAVDLLNTFLEDKEWLAGGDSPSVADYALSATVLGVQLFKVDFSQATNIERWLENSKSNLAGWEFLEDNVAVLKSFLPPKA